ncbi:hypothetical protein SDC9_93107 [bioreactor metagenome]|uniref:Uncharacterized protein n=1 Tax=bioreactor metagenome TaxID=1076179 RepID=A0A645A042_9ZZZZ
MQTMGKSDVDNPLLPVDQGVLPVRRKAHHRLFTAVGQIVFHVGGTGLLVCAHQDADTPPEGKPRLLQCLERIERGHRGALVVHGASSEHLPVPDIAGKRVAAPALSDGDHVQMAQHGHHFLPRAVLTPAGLIAKVPHCEAQILSRVQHKLQALLNIRAVGIAAAVLLPNAGNADTLPQGRQQRFPLPLHKVFQFHRALLSILCPAAKAAAQGTNHFLLSARKKQKPSKDRRNSSIFTGFPLLIDILEDISHKGKQSLKFFIRSFPPQPDTVFPRPSWPPAPLLRRSHDTGGPPRPQSGRIAPTETFPRKYAGGTSPSGPESACS